jgi:hypothetical protein
VRPALRAWSAALALTAVVIAAGTVLGGCAGSQGPKSGPIVEAKGPVFVAMPALPDSLDSALAPLGWGGGRFARELRKEIRYQFNRKGQATPEDSAQAKALLTVNVTAYAAAGGNAFAAAALLTTPSGARRMGFRKGPGRAEAPERDDPTVDDIRLIASSLVEDARRDPARSKRRDAEKSEYNPQMLILF